jgi:hypothetical protein
MVPDDDRLARAVFLGSTLCFGVAVQEIWGDFGSGGDTRAGLSVFVLGVIGFLLAPALRRLRGQAPPRASN